MQLADILRGGGSNPTFVSFLPFTWYVQIAHNVCMPSRTLLSGKGCRIPCDAVQSKWVEDRWMDKELHFHHKTINVTFLEYMERAAYLSCLSLAVG